MQTVIFYDTKPYEKDFFEIEIDEDIDITYIDSNLLTDREITEQEQNADVISVFTLTKLDKQVLQKFKKLKLILTRSVGYSHIDIDYCNSRNIIVANTPHYGDYTVAEFSFGLLLSLVRRIGYGQHELKLGDMYPETYGMELYNKTIGIIGTGAIGSKSIRIAKGFSMNVICYDINENKDLTQEYNAKYVDLDTLCKFSDVIMLHAPFTSHNYHMLDKEKLSLMKDTAVIVNTARGELIDTEALYDALIENKIQGAALDVFEFEETISNKRPTEKINLKNLRISLINNKLLNLPNVVATPHIAYDTKEAINRILQKTIKSLKEFLSGKEIEYRVR